MDYMDTYLLVLFAVIAVSDTKFIYLDHDNNADILPDSGRSWFNQPKPKRPTGPPIGRPFVPDKHSPYKLYDTVADGDPFQFHEDTTEKSVTRSSDITDPTLADSVYGDSYYGMDAPKLHTDIEQVELKVSELRTANPINTGYQIPHYSPAVSVMHTSDEIHFQHPVEHDTTDSEIADKHVANTDTHTESEAVDTHVENELEESSEQSLIHEDEVTDGYHKVHTNKPHAEKAVHTENELGEVLEQPTLHEEEEEITEGLHKVHTNNKPHVEKVIHIFKNEHTANSPEVVLDKQELPGHIVNEKPPPIHINENEINRLPVKRPSHEESPSFPEADAIDSENEALHANKQFGDTFSTATHTTSVDEENRAFKLPMEMKHEQSMSHVSADHVMHHHKHLHDGHHHHHITIDTDTGEIVPAEKEHSLTSQDGEASHSLSNQDMELSHSVVDQELEPHETGHEAEASPQEDSVQLHHHDHHHLHLHNHLVHHTSPHSDEPTPQTDDHETEAGSEVEANADLELRNHEEEHASKIVNDVHAHHYVHNGVQRHTLKQQTHKERNDKTDKSTTKSVSTSNSDDKADDSMVKPVLTSNESPTALEDSMDESTYTRLVEGIKHNSKHLRYTPPKDTFDHEHEDETFDNNEISNESEDTTKENPKRQPHAKPTKPAFALEPKILKEHEIVEPGYMLHGDPHGDGLGDGVIDGPDVGSSEDVEKEIKESRNNKSVKRHGLDSESGSIEDNIVGLKSRSDAIERKLEKLKTEESNLNKRKTENKNSPNEEKKENEEGTVHKRFQNIGDSQDEINIDFDSKIANKSSSNINTSIETDRSAKQNEKTEGADRSTKQDGKNEGADQSTKQDGKNEGATLENENNVDEVNDSVSSLLNKAAFNKAAFTVINKAAKNLELAMTLDHTASKNDIATTNKPLIKSRDTFSGDYKDVNEKVNKEHDGYVKEKAKDTKAVSRTSHLDLDVKSTKYIVPDHQLTLPITNPGHPDESNGVSLYTYRKHVPSNKMPLLNPQPTNQNVMPGKSSSSLIQYLRKQALKTDKGYVKNAISRAKKGPRVVKVTGRESELELEPFFVANETNALTESGSNDVTTRSFQSTFNTEDNLAFDLGDNPTDFGNKPTVGSQSHVRVMRSSLKQVRKKKVMKKSIIAEEGLQTNSEYEFNSPESYNNYQHFLLQLVENADKPKLRKRVLSLKRSLGKRHVTSEV